MRTGPAGRHLLFGAFMGTAEAVPGVSGGTVALILGIYGRLVTSVKEISTAAVLASRDRRRAAEHWRAVDWGLLLPLALGIVAAVAVGAFTLPALLERYRQPMLGLFFGLVAGSLLVPWRQIGERRRLHVLLLLAGAATAFVLTGIPPQSTEDPSLVRVLLSASVAVCALILPGVSGAFLLQALGMYEVSLEAGRAFDVVYIGVFAAGAAVGLGVFAKLLSYLLRTRRDATMALLTGLMAGALRALWPWQGEGERRELLAPQATWSTLLAVVLATLACAGIVYITRAGRRTPAVAES